MGGIVIQDEAGREVVLPEPRGCALVQTKIGWTVIAAPGIARELVDSEAAKVKAWLLGQPAKPTMPDDVREYLRKRVREQGSLGAAALLEKYPEEV